MPKLNHYQVLVLRPGKAGEALCQEINNWGINAIHLPTIDFLDLTHETSFRQQLSKINEQQWLIFTSQMACHFALPHLYPLLKNSTSPPRLAAVGNHTANYLQEKLQLTVLYPDEAWGSEALLNLLPFSSPKNERMMIVKGVGGRDLLETELEKRGALVSSLMSYQRLLPKLDVLPYVNLLKQGKISAIIGASLEEITNLKNLLGEKYTPFLLTIPLIVLSERIKILAQSLGFQTICVAKKGSYIQKLADLFNR